MTEPWILHSGACENRLYACMCGKILLPNCIRSFLSIVVVHKCVKMRPTYSRPTSRTPLKLKRRSWSGWVTFHSVRCCCRHHLACCYQLPDCCLLWPVSGIQILGLCFFAANVTFLSSLWTDLAKVLRELWPWVKLKVHQISAHLVHRELRNATFEGEKTQT